MLKWDEVMRLETYEKLRTYADEHAAETTAQDRWSMVERMRQVRYGYAPGTLRMNRTHIKSFTMEEFEPRRRWNTNRRLRSMGHAD